MSCSSKWLNLKERVMGPPNYRWVGQSVGDLGTPLLDTGTELSEYSWDWALSRWVLMLSPGRQCQNWVKLLEPRWWWRIGWCGKNPTHLMSEVLSQHKSSVSFHRACWESEPILGTTRSPLPLRHVLSAPQGLRKKRQEDKKLWSLFLYKRLSLILFFFMVQSLFFRTILFH